MKNSLNIFQSLQCDPRWPWEPRLQWLAAGVGREAALRGVWAYLGVVGGCGDGDRAGGSLAGCWRWSYGRAPAGFCSPCRGGRKEGGGGGSTSGKASGRRRSGWATDFRSEMAGTVPAAVSRGVARWCLNPRLGAAQCVIEEVVEVQVCPKGGVGAWRRMRFDLE
jgi:hypothetical protein